MWIPFQNTQEGKKEQKIFIARNLKKAGIDIKIISDNTGLTIEEIENLWTNNFFIEEIWRKRIWILTL